VTLFLVAMNGFFVAAEFAIVKVRASQLELKAQKGNRFATLGRHILLNLDGYLAATQLGITFASLGLGWIGEPVVSKIIIRIFTLMGVTLSPETSHAIALPIAFSIITVLHIVFGELAPKSFAIQRSEETTLAVAYPLHFFYILFKPFIWLLNGFATFILKSVGLSASHASEIHSRDELKLLIKLGSESGMIKSDSYSIIRNAFDFSERTAKQVMIPRSTMIAINVNEYSEVAIEKLIEENYSRIPCYESTLDNVIGVIHLKDLLLSIHRRRPINMRDLMRPVMYVPETKRIGQLLREFQIKHQQIAIVVSEFGGTEGIITMEDILEELVGEIQDEHDIDVKIVEQLDERTYAAFASASISDINGFLPSPIERTKDYETLAGMLLHKFNRIPNTNEKMVLGTYEFTVLKKNSNTILLVRIRCLPAADNP